MTRFMAFLCRKCEIGRNSTEHILIKACTASSDIDVTITIQIKGQDLHLEGTIVTALNPE